MIVSHLLQPAEDGLTGMIQSRLKLYHVYHMIQPLPRGDGERRNQMLWKSQKLRRLYEVPSPMPLPNRQWRVLIEFHMNGQAEIRADAE